MKKEFTMIKKDGTTAKFQFEKSKGSIWYWNVPLETKGEIGSLPLPDVELNKAKDLQDCLHLIAEKRGSDWVMRVVHDILLTKDAKQEATIET